MSKISKIFIPAILSLVFAFPAAAQVAPAPDNILREMNEAGQEARMESREAIQKLRQEFQNRMEETNALRERIQNEFKERFENKREEVKNRIQVKREELKQNLQKIKDERKKEIVVRIADNINALNERMLKHFSDTLVHLESVLGKIASRADKAAANGRDITAVQTAINDANKAIAVSRAAIEAQAAKAYDITINTEDALKQDVGKARQLLHSDLVTVRETVFAAREAVKKAAQALYQISGIDNLELPEN
jgi:chromosome segregation ATPase